MIFLRKYTDLAVQSPRGKVLKAIILNNIDSLDALLQSKSGIKKDGLTLISEITWGVFFNKWTEIKIVNTYAYFLVDQWIESQLIKMSHEISKP